MPESEKHPLLEFSGWADIVAQNSDMNPADFALQMRSEYGEFTPAIAEQLECYRKAEKKLSGLHTHGWIYRKRSLEQSSGTAAAVYKASLFSGDVCLDLTGGLGIDTLAFSHHFGKVHHIEPDEVTSDLANHNLTLSGRENITFHKQTAEEFLSQHSEKASLIYADPSRRDESGRVFRLSDCVPDITLLREELKTMAEKVMLKLSPMYDIHQLLRELPETQWVKVVSVRGEVKEILAGWDTKNPGEEVKISAVLLQDDGAVNSELHRKIEDSLTADILSVEKIGWVTLPDPAITKAGLTDKAAEEHHMSRISIQHDALGAETEPENFPGRIFKVMEVLPYNPKGLQKLIRRSGWKSAHIYRRDFPVEVPQLHKKFGLPMGPDVHLLFLSDAENNRQVLVCEQVQV